jgi:hypothetical protein
MNNQEQIDLNNLNKEQLEKLLLNIQSTIGQLEIDKQLQLYNYNIVMNRYAMLKQQEQQPMAKMPVLKKLNLPNSEATYTINK